MVFVPSSIMLSSGSTKSFTQSLAYTPARCDAMSPFSFPSPPPPSPSTFKEERKREKRWVCMRGRDEGEREKRGRCVRERQRMATRIERSLTHPYCSSGCKVRRREAVLHNTSLFYDEYSWSIVVHTSGRSRSTVDHIDHVFAVMRCAAYVSYVVP